MDYEGLMRQAAHTADYYLLRAIESIDMHLGRDSRDPLLIAAYMSAATADFEIMVRVKDAV